MSDTDIQKQDTPQAPSSPSENEQEALQVPEFIINKKTGEMTIIDPSGKKIAMKATIIEEDDEDDDDEQIPVEPLTVVEFKDALGQLESLGLTWSADSPPAVIPKDSESENSLGKEAFFLLQQEYPQLPREVSLTVTYVLTGNESFAEYVGGIDRLRKKAEIVKQSIITTDYRSEFFFKHSIKVPYLSDIDWEVVLKFSERSVAGCPAVSYGLLSLLLREPSTFGKTPHRRIVTVAVDEATIDRYITMFENIKESLQASRQITDNLHLPNSASNKKKKRANQK